MLLICCLQTDKMKTGANYWNLLDQMDEKISRKKL